MSAGLDLRKNLDSLLLHHFASFVKISPNKQQAVLQLYEDIVSLHLKYFLWGVLLSLALFRKEFQENNESGSTFKSGILYLIDIWLTSTTAGRLKTLCNTKAKSGYRKQLC